MFLAGGRYGDAVALYRAISQQAPEAMAENVARYRAEGYARFQLKVGSTVREDVARIRAVAEVLDPGEPLVADANTGWLLPDAARVVEAVKDLDVYIEQPCKSYEACLAVRQRTALPFILDENIDGLEMLLRAHRDRAMDAINLKISKVGGLTKARHIRDLCVALGIPMTIEDSWGGDIVTAAIAHLAHIHPRAVSLHGNRLQQLRNRGQCNRRAAAACGNHACFRPTRPRCDGQPRRVGQASRSVSGLKPSPFIPSR